MIYGIYIHRQHVLLLHIQICRILGILDFLLVRKAFSKTERRKKNQLFHLFLTLFVCRFSIKLYVNFIFNKIISVWNYENLVLCPVSVLICEFINPFPTKHYYLKKLFFFMPQWLEIRLFIAFSTLLFAYCLKNSWNEQISRKVKYLIFCYF